MKILILMRHAKSDWGDPGLADFDRPLNARGRDAAPKIGRYIRDGDLEPDAVWCSTAKRARQTWLLVEEVLAGNPRVEHDESLYLAPPDTILEVTKGAPDDISRLMIIGHNPGLHDLACSLPETAEDSGQLHRLEQGLPTAAFAMFTFDIDSWANLGRGHLAQFVRPKDL